MGRVMAVEETGYYDNFCIYCMGSGVVRGYEDEVTCGACGGRGQWDDDEDYGFMHWNSGHTVMCILCGAHGYGWLTHDDDGNRIPGVMAGASWSPWQRKHLAPHPYSCACGRSFPDLHGLGTHVSAHRRHRNPGHGSLERVGY